MKVAAVLVSVGMLALSIAVGTPSVAGFCVTNPVTEECVEDDVGTLVHEAGRCAGSLGADCPAPLEDGVPCVSPGSECPVNPFPLLISLTAIATGSNAPGVCPDALEEARQCRRGEVFPCNPTMPPHVTFELSGDIECVALCEPETRPILVPPEPFEEAPSLALAFHQKTFVLPDGTTIHNVPAICLRVDGEDPCDDMLGPGTVIFWILEEGDEPEVKPSIDPIPLPQDLEICLATVTLFVNFYPNDAEPIGVSRPATPAFC